MKNGGEMIHEMNSMFGSVLIAYTKCWHKRFQLQKNTLLFFTKDLWDLRLSILLPTSFIFIFQEMKQMKKGNSCQSYFLSCIIKPCSTGCSIVYEDNLSHS